MRSTICVICAAAIAAASPAGAQPREPGHARLLDKLAGCAVVPDRDARLACYETAAGELKAAEARGDIVVVDREQAQAVRRQAFGFSLPSLSLFDRDEHAAALDRVTARLTSASRGGDGRWTFQLDDGAVWTQVDNDILLVTPRAGQAAVVKAGMMGAFFLDLDGHAGVRVRRVR